MAKKDEKKATPRLRFPEFREVWQYESIEPYLEECGSRIAAPTTLPIYTSSRAGLNPQASYYSGHTIINDGEYGVVPPNCFVYRHMSDDGKFQFNINETGVPVAVSKEYPVFRTVDLDPHFLHGKLNYSDEFKRFALSEKAGGTRTRLYFSKLVGWKTLLPSLAEQRKIADCLDSLDELISAQGRRVEALKAHKRGLMQELFPREGETRPRLRFPEFMEAPEWDGNALADACRMQAGKFLSASQIREQSREKLYPCYGGNGLRGYTETYTHSGKFPLIGRQGALCGNVRLGAGKFHATEHAVVASPKNRIDTDWLYFALVFLDLNRFATGQAQPGLSVEVLEKVPLAIPASEYEQQRIASCLSSLDSLIAAEAEKLEVLRTHKKGLMQGLFPAVAEES